MYDIFNFNDIAIGPIYWCRECALVLAMDRLPKWHDCVLRISLILFSSLCTLFIVESAKIQKNDAVSKFESGPTISSAVQNHNKNMDTEYGFEELAIIKLLTTVRRRRGVIKNDYHILKIDLPQSNKSLKVHLVNNDHPVSPEVLVHDGISSTKMSADSNTHLYLGTTTIESDGISSNESVHGSAAISLSSKNNGKRIEFSGLLILGADHFVLQPTKEKSIKNYTIQISPHMVFRRTKNNTTRQHDVLRVPKDDLIKAVEEMRNRFENDESENATLNEISEETEDDFRDKDFSPDQSLSFESQVPMAVASGNKKNKKKASSSNKMIIEIAVFTDAALFRKMKMKTSKETVERVKNIALTVVNNMNLLYKEPSMGVDIGFRLVLLEIMKNNPKNMSTHDGHASKYLSSFCQYAGDKNKKGELWDHALMLTGLNTFDDDSESVVGLAWFKTMCLQYWSCSISEGQDFESVFTVAHEIGHSLGMEHDGYGPSIECDPELYLMSPTTGIGKVTWSKCSTSNIKEFIKTGDPEVGEKDVKRKPLCLTKNSPRTSKAVKFSDGRLPGQIYKTSDQCRLQCGGSCKPYKDNYYPYNDVCKMLYCEETSKSKGSDVKEAHPALEGTNCGNTKGKHCRGAKCVAVGKQ